MSRRIAIVGGGIAGVTAAWQIARGDSAAEVTLFEASVRLGGTVETVWRDGFVVECGPDGWVSEKPWARELCVELGLGDELIYSNDATRVTYILREGRLVAMPDGMRMMVPTDLSVLEGSELFSEAAKQAYAAEPRRAAELRAGAPEADESVAEFVERHFGREVLRTLAAPLLSGVFGGDVRRLSVRAVMPQFVQMERLHGSLITALQARRGVASQPIFTTLRCGLETLIERMVTGIPAKWIRLGCRVRSVEKSAGGWVVDGEEFDDVVMAVPAHVARPLLAHVDARFGELLAMEESSAVIAAFGFRESFALPRGFGFLVPQGETNSLLAGTFADQKFAGKGPEGMRLVRAFFGGTSEPADDLRRDEELAAEALADVVKIVGPLPEPSFAIVRRWPRSLPQYGVGHLERMSEVFEIAATLPGLHLLGNAYRGVGLPDLVRDARAVGMGLGA